MTQTNTSQTPAWWRFGHVWLVISGPLLVVVASFVSAYVAFQGDDTALIDDPAAIRAAHQMQVNKDHSMVPAIQARNHAASADAASSKP